MYESHSSKDDKVTKQVVFLAATVLLAFGSASAFTFGVDYTEAVQDNGLGATGFDYVSTVDFKQCRGFIGWGRAESWEHTLSADYTPVPEAYQIASARLDITGYRYFGLGADLVEFAGSLNWTEVEGWRWVSHSENSFDLSGIDHSYWNAPTFQVAMTPVFDLGLRLQQSVLSIDYIAGGGPRAEFTVVPEPASLILVGLGLAGVMGVRARRGRK
jgi:hypothetical protein